ncbi:hypothetical protein [Paenibacillus durus]|uniref:Uncharacterized protein n=1 Tax=Paenibacillus durus ATCC 35681 TaxID=1333534 RepID=A0A0F7CJH6_PAEDU|nr:hypothetical protein [Paenibacillus durus]AKG36181.1 hypothetical protein VK70_17775 [Paenibacillus durus ATCC 35681]
MRIKPNYKDMGLSTCMGQHLRKEVERQLIKDLNNYNSYLDDLRFDWSESCIEGKCLKYLDGLVENFSGIMIFNKEDRLVADGWMDFIYLKEKDRFVVYWDFLDIYIDGKEFNVKTNSGVPEHINDLSEE